jgi:hypothetical protein
MMPNGQYAPPAVAQNALKGLYIPAQGNALGYAEKKYPEAEWALL